MVTGAFGPETVAGGVPGAKTTVPPATPGPVPSLPALSVKPSGKPRLCEGILLPLVSVIFAPTLISWPAPIAMLPSVVVMAATGSRLILCPALSKTLPLVVVIAAFTLASRPQHTTKFPLVAVMAAFTLTSRAAFNDSVVVLGVAVQLTASLTLISPLPGVAVFRVLTGGVPATSVRGPVAVVITTLLVTSRAESVAPLMLSVATLPMVKSCGSISQVPVSPVGAAVLTLASLAIITCAADVSMKPPLPPLGALASSVPP